LTDFKYGVTKTNYQGNGEVNGGAVSTFHAFQRIKADISFFAVFLASAPSLMKITYGISM
jgi:hypothetical protein